jgi:hypothetical protein
MIRIKDDMADEGPNSFHLSMNENLFYYFITLWFSECINSTNIANFLEKIKFIKSFDILDWVPSNIIL